MLLAGVFTPNPREGTGSKGLGVMRIKVPGNAGHLFFIQNTKSVYFTWTVKLGCPFLLLKEKMKYLMTFIVGLALSLSFVACGDEDKEEAGNPADTGAEILDTGDEETVVEDTGDAIDTGDVEDTGSDASADTAD